MYHAPKTYESPKAFKSPRSYKSPVAIKTPKTPQCGSLDASGEFTSFASGTGYSVTIPLSLSGGHMPKTGDSVVAEMDGESSLTGSLSGGLSFVVDPASSGETFTVYIRLVDTSSSDPYLDGPVATRSFTIP